MHKGWATLGMLGLVAGLAGAAVTMNGKEAPAPPASAPPPLAATAPAPAPFVLGECAAPVGGDAPTATVAADPKVRDAAQRGLTFLERSATDWQSRNQCMGCHVQAVTVEALSVGQRNGYDLDQRSLETLIAGLTTGNGGSRTAGGLQYHGGTLVAASEGFGGAAFARYDALVDGAVRDDLLTVARQLAERQGEDGGVVDAEHWVNAPVGVGGIQLAAQAIATWRQAYERTADDAWSATIARTEGWLKGRLDGMDPATADLQQLNWALTGLLEAGGTPSEGRVRELITALGARQSEGGGWSLSGGGDDAFATGQTLYVLRRLGLSDADPVVRRGTAWLVAHQTTGGGWRSGGVERAEAMWAVLGLVSVDQLTVTLEGLTDGQHVDGTLPLDAIAASNQGAGVKQIELSIDDRPLDGACGGHLATTWDTATLSPGRHLVEVKATDGRGRTALRRLEVFSGDHLLTRLGTTWDDGGTRIGVRNVAPAGRRGTLRLEILEGSAVLHQESLEASPGANTFWWPGEGAVGKKLVARVSFVDGDRVVHAEEIPFVHADPAYQQASFGTITGSVGFGAGGGGGLAENAVVELVDQLGNVVQRAATTRDGAYRFKNVDAQEYKLRVVKEGFVGTEAAVKAEKGVEAAPAAALELQ